MCAQSASQWLSTLRGGVLSRSVPELSYYYSSLLVYDRYHLHNFAYFPSSLTDPARSCPTCLKHPGTPIVNCGQSAHRIFAHTLQVPQPQYVVTWASRDNRATM